MKMNLPSTCLGSTPDRGGPESIRAAGAAADRCDRWCSAGRPGRCAEAAIAGGGPIVRVSLMEHRSGNGTNLQHEVPALMGGMQAGSLQHTCQEHHLRVKDRSRLELLVPDRSDRSLDADPRPSDSARPGAEHG